jgi:ABC-type transport system involved in multi-copper enzyme maturation permease subunit
MENALQLLALAPRWSAWLTPIWILGLGALTGAGLLCILWGMFRVLSRVPQLGSIAADPKRTVRLTTIMAGVLSLLVIPLLIVPSAADRGLFETILLSGASMLLSWCACYAFLVLCWRRTVDEIIPAVQEGALWYMLILVVTAFAWFGVVGAFLVDRPADVISSIARIPATGETSHTASVAGPTTADEEPISTVDVEFRTDELRAMSVSATGRLTFSYRPFEESTEDQMILVTADEPYQEQRPDLSPPGNVLIETVRLMHVRNESGQAIEMSITYRTAPAYAQVRSIPMVALVIALITMIYLVQRAAMPRMSAIALATFKSEIAQPLFWLAVGFGAFAIVVFVYIPYNTFGEDIKMLKDTGLTMIMVLGIIVALWSASNSVAEEIEGRTALTVLSKPLGRRSFVLGKFIGISWTTLLLFVFLGGWFLVWVARKPIFDSREYGTGLPPWELCYVEMMSVLPGLLLAYMETLVLAALSVAISTRLNLLANFTICLTIYLLGHLTPLVVQSNVTSFEIVRFFGQLIATIFPNLEHFNVQAAVAAGVDVPYEYLAWAFCYCLVYSVIAMLLALIMFEDRDLA